MQAARKYNGYVTRRVLQACSGGAAYMPTGHAAEEMLMVGGGKTHRFEYQPLARAELNGSGGVLPQQTVQRVSLSSVPARWCRHTIISQLGYHANQSSSQPQSSTGSLGTCPKQPRPQHQHSVAFFQPTPPHMPVRCSHVCTTGPQDNSHDLHHLWCGVERPRRPYVHQRG
jgi:hypothetical protein